ncbi:MULTISPECIES: LemA family protein [Pseudoalteromonas]|uniref:LemA family protein n=1 Tax=Pseudoalteromonas TaxID=53246 RepID=UPI00026C9543|nr:MULTISPECIES: LemA family protein [Pseudoalteromonas]ATC98669.1 LemA protein [Pseudoalteromonas spongiae UST010723-006]
MSEFLTANWLLISILVVFIVIFYAWYVSIITKRNAMEEAFSGIDVQLKKRTDLIPNVLAIAKKFMTHEKELLEEVTRLRTDVLNAASSNNNEQRFKLEGQLENSLSGLMIAVENYPELKSDATMLDAQRTYADVEAHISAARRNFNSANRVLRNAIQVFPGNIIAAMVGVKAMAFFEISESERQPVNAAELLN